MNLTPEQLRQTAAAMFAFADGKPVQYCILGRDGSWNDANDPSWDFEACEYRPRPWSLPAPPAGRKWHREDFTEEMLPVIDGKPTRPLLDGEKKYNGDFLKGYRFALDGTPWSRIEGMDENGGEICSGFFYRTTRPLPKEPTVRWWRQEDVPCGIYLRNAGKQDAHYLPANICRDGIEITFKGKNYFLTWETLAKFYEHSTDRKTWLPCTVTEEGE